MKKRKFFLLSLLILTTNLFLQGEANPLWGEENSSFKRRDSQFLIEKAYKEGRLSYQLALNYKVYSLFNPQKLPFDFSSKEKLGCATPIIMEAKVSPYLLNLENRFILFRPTDSEDEDFYGKGVEVLTYDSSQGHFKLHYTLDNTYGDAVPTADNDSSGTPDYVEDFARYFEEIWNKQVNDWGFNPPSSDNGAGGDDKLDVYILNLNAYGYISYTGTVAYIVVDNDYQSFPANLDPEGNQKGAMKVTAAHEFFHTLQITYSTNLANIWWMENTATWAEDETYTQVNDYLHYLGLRYDDPNDNGRWDSGESYYSIDGSLAGTQGRSSLWFDYPQRPLDSTLGYQEYGGVVWVKYLSEKYGSGIIKNIWERTTTLTALKAIKEELESRGSSLAEALKEFRVKNFTRNYSEGSYYPLVFHEGSYSSYPQSILSSNLANGNLAHLSSHYLLFKISSSATDLNITFDGEDNGYFGVKVVKVTLNNGYEEAEITLSSSSQSGSLIVKDFGLSYKKVVLIVLNQSENEDNKSYSLTVSTSQSSPSQESSSEGEEGKEEKKGGGGGGCFIATSLYGRYNSPPVKLLRDFRDRYLLIIPGGKGLVLWYYRKGPILAQYLVKYPFLKIIGHLFVLPLLSLSFFLIKLNILEKLVISFSLGVIIILKFNIRNKL